MRARPEWTEHDRLQAAFAEAMVQGRGGSGMFGLRLQRHSFAYFAERLAQMVPDAPGDAARMRAMFGATAFIYLRRQDKVAQAVSYVTAEQSGLWHRAADGSELERLAPPREPVCDAEAIRQCCETMQGNDRDWEAWFAREGLRPLRLSYEALAAAPQAELARVLEHLGLPGEAARGTVPGVRKLADATSRAWIARYRDEDGRG